jgi:hypothetical protein
LGRPYCFCRQLPSLNVEVIRVPVELATLDLAGDCTRDRVEGCIPDPAEGSIPDRAAVYIQDPAVACIQDPVGVFIRGQVVACIQGRAEEFIQDHRVVKEPTKVPGVRALPAPKAQSGLSKTALNELA